MAPPAYRSGGIVNGNAVDVPPGAAINDIVIICWWLNPSSATRTPPAEFTQAPSSPFTQPTTNTMKCQVWWKRLTAADTGTYALADTGVTYAGLICAAFSGCVTTGSPFDATNSNTGAGSVSSPPVSVTTTGADRLLAWFGGEYYSSTWTAPSGFTAGTPAAASTMIAYKQQAVAGASGSITGTNTYSNTGNAYMGAWLGALLPVPSSAPAPAGFLPFFTTA